MDREIIIPDEMQEIAAEQAMLPRLKLETQFTSSAKSGGPRISRLFTIL